MGEEDKVRGIALVREAAQLDCAQAQHFLGENGFKDSERERYYWWGRASARGHPHALNRLQSAATKQLALFEAGGTSGRVLFEIGAAFERAGAGGGRRAVQLYRQV
jgi:hypothetical protein